MDSMQYRPPNANQEVSNSNQFGSVSDSLGRLAALPLVRFGHPMRMNDVNARGTCLRRPLGTRRPPRLFEKLESYCIKMGS